MFIYIEKSDSQIMDASGYKECFLCSLSLIKDFMASRFRAVALIPKYSLTSPKLYIYFNQY